MRAPHPLDVCQGLTPDSWERAGAGTDEPPDPGRLGRALAWGIVCSLPIEALLLWWLWW